MAKVGYIFNVPHYEGIDKDKAWMMDYGCVNIIEESSDMEANILVVFAISHRFPLSMYWGP